MMKEAMIEKFKGSGLKLTPQRLAIFNFLDGRTDHPSAEAIFEGVKKEHPTISFATVYNTVEAMRDAGAVLELNIDGHRRHYDPNTASHHHVICTSCGKICDIFSDFNLLSKLPGNVLGEFDITSSSVNFYGICKACSSK